MLSEKLGLPDQEKDKIRKSALLHDLGKIGIPDAILHKKGSLSEEEFSIMKQHGMLSAKILKPIKDFEEVISYVIHHHESFDGSGYLHGLAGKFIPLGASLNNRACPHPLAYNRFCLTYYYKLPAHLVLKKFVSEVRNQGFLKKGLKRSTPVVQ